VQPEEMYIKRKKLHHSFPKRYKYVFNFKSKAKVGGKVILDYIFQSPLISSIQDDQATPKTEILLQSDLMSSPGGQEICINSMQHHIKGSVYTTEVTYV
jgi:hypothetical protein